MENARNGNTPLHKTLHYRKIRKLLTVLCQCEGINLKSFDPYNMRAYRCIGSTLKGKNTWSNLSKGTNCSPFVGDNHYEVIEIPSKSNKRNFTGEYLLLVKNSDFDYWMLILMKHSIDYTGTIARNRFSEKVKFFPYGKYSVSFDGQDIYISKEVSGVDCTFGGDQHRNKYFDAMGVRAKAYGISLVDEMNKICERKQNQKHGLIDQKAVKIYNKKRNNR